MGNDCSASNICNRQLSLDRLNTHRPTIPLMKGDTKTIEEFHSLLSSISQKNWVLREDSFLCPEKFFSAYNEYLRDQTLLSEVWSNVQTEEELTRGSDSPSFFPHFKLLVRTGVPLDHFRSIVLDLFKKENSSNNVVYDCALKVAFPGGVPEVFKNVPLFSYSHHIEDVLPVHFLTEKGLEALKRIMWVYEKNVAMLEYSPLLPQAVALLLLFLKEDETYCVVREMIDTSEKLLDIHLSNDGLKSLRWHLTLNKDQFEVFLESLSTFLRDRPNDMVRLWRHFHKLNYDCNDLFWQMIKTLFLGFLPLSVCLKIFMAYLNEGIKIYGRFALALLKLFENDILLCTDSQTILLTVKDKASHITKPEVQLLVTTAYRLRLGQLKRRLPSIHPQTFHAPESAKLYYPQLSNPSSITSTSHFETIWEWLSNNLKLTNPTLAYCSKTHGWSINTLYSKCAEMLHYKGVLILIKTVNSVTFGAFVDGMAETHGGPTTSIGTDESFVFQLEPEEKRYKSSKKSDVHMICDRDFLSVGGGGEGPAIYLSNDLLYGYSYRSETYENQPLNQTNEVHDTYFECNAVEIYWVD